MANWYVTIKDRQHGPLSDAQLKSAAAKGQIGPLTPIRKESMKAPVPAGKVKGLFAPPVTAAEGPSASAQTDGSTEAAGGGESETAPSWLEEYEETKQDVDDNAMNLSFKKELGRKSQSIHEPYKAPSTIAEENKERLAATTTPNSFFSALPEAFIYPFKGRGSLIIFGLAFTIVFVPNIIPLRLYIYFLRSQSFHIFLFLILALIYIYVAAYIFRVGRSTIDGEKTPPPLPDMSDFTEQISFPALLLCTTCIISLLPYFAYSWEYRLIGISYDFWGVFAEFHKLILTWPTDAIGWILRIAGLIYYPMALMAVTARGSFDGLNPQLVFRAIVRTPMACAVAVLFISLKFVLWNYVAQWMLKRNPGDPYSSMWFSIMILVALILYSLVVQGRIIGLLYTGNRKKLKFVETA
jgi:hypothetical protein